MDDTLKRIRQQVISLVILAFWAGTAFAFTIADYRKSPTNFDGVSILVCAVLLFGTILHSTSVWMRLKELEPPN